MKIAKLLALCALIGLILISCACAASNKTEFMFDQIHAKVSFDTSPYEAVLTPNNLTEYTSWLRERNDDPDATAARFESEGILLEAYDKTNSRVIVISAQEDAKSKQFFDINQQEESVRKTYRQAHTNGTYYGIIGYHYSSATWKNYGKSVGRFLRLKYELRQNAQIVCRGYQRRTVRNGYTITVDVKVNNRDFKSGDEKALEGIMDGFSFTEILDAPEGQCKLSMTKEPAKEMNTQSFTLEGKTDAYAEVTVNLISMTTSATASYTETAKKSGKFSVKAKFPEQGTFTVQLNIKAQDGDTATRTYTTMYRENYLPISLSSNIPTNISADTLTISGETAKKVKVQLSVTGPISYNKTHTGSSFNFTVDTSAEGTYEILLVASKKGLETRSLSYTVTRTFGEAERIQKIRDMSNEVTYKKLTSKYEDYVGKTLKFTGYVLEIISNNNEWTLKIALNKSGTTYKSLIYVICSDEPSVAVADQVTVYGTLTEDMYTEVSGSTINDYPRLVLQLLEEAK